jgi:hypothetical protein
MSPLCLRRHGGEFDFSDLDSWVRPRKPAIYDVSPDVYFKSAKSASNCAMLNPCGVVFLPVR